MVTDQQVRRLMKLTQSEATVAQAAAKAGMDEKTARKYRRVKQLPSQIRKPHEWRTRADVLNRSGERLRDLGSASKGPGENDV